MEKLRKKGVLQNYWSEKDISMLCIMWRQSNLCRYKKLFLLPLTKKQKRSFMLGIFIGLFYSDDAALYGGVLKNLCEGLGSARKRRSRGFRSELHSSNEGGRMFEPEGRVCAGA